MNVWRGKVGKATPGLGVKEADEKEREGEGAGPYRLRAGSESGIRGTEEETVMGIRPPRQPVQRLPGGAYLWDKLAVGPLAPQPSYPLLPCSLLQSVASPYVGTRVD